MEKPKTQLTFLILLIAIFLPLEASSFYTSHSATLIKISLNTEPSEGDHGERLPEIPIEVNIDYVYGITFITIEKPFINSFEILDEKGQVRFITDCESEFIQYLFSLTGTFKLRMTTDTAIYIGKISM